MSETINAKIVFIAHELHGRCPRCRRKDRILGTCTVDLGKPAKRCVDCFFSTVAVARWIRCRACHLIQPPGDACSDCGSKMGASK